MLTFNEIVECVINKPNIFKERLIETVSFAARVKITGLFNLSLILKSHKLAIRVAKEMVREYQRVQQLEIQEQIKLLQDYTDIRNEIIEKCEDRTSANKEYSFFYDESNNYRVFRIKNGKFNESPEKYFVLGGVCTRINTLFEFSQQELGLQSKCDEIKSKKWYQGKDFYWCMNDKRLQAILKWIDRNEVFLHIEAVDHFKIIARDLCKMCCTNQGEGERLICENTFYNCMKSDVEGIQHILARYEYPNIDNENLKEFLSEFKEFVLALSESKKTIDKIDEVEKAIFWGIPIETIERAVNGDISFETRDKIINDYAHYYIIKPLLFLNSKHTYDEETEIEKILTQDTFSVNGEKIHNYCFVNSKSEMMVQISDVIVAVLARFFQCVNSFELGENTLYSIDKLRGNLRTQLQQENFCLLMKLLRKSMKENELFIRIDGDFVNMNALKLLKSISAVSREGVTLKPND